MELDTEPRTVRPPRDLQQALSADPKAKAAFAKLSFTHRKEYVDWIKEAKRPETRRRRVEQTVARVSQGP
jgi:uncharacterized protein YdeI (YjbR/CyaY-like superfamily)